MLSPKGTEESLHFGDIIYDKERGTLEQKGEIISLTSVENDLLKVLAQRAGQEVSREELASITHTENERTIDVQINRLRKKIEQDSKNPRYLQTIRGKGYLLLPD